MKHYYSPRKAECVGESCKSPVTKGDYCKTCESIFMKYPTFVAGIRRGEKRAINGASRLIQRLVGY